MKKLFALAVLATLLSNTSAMASDWQVIGVHVTVVEATYVPTIVDFQVDTAAGSSCPAGAWLTWKGQGPDLQAQRDNVKAVYALRLAAKLSQTPVNIFGNNAGCVVTFIHLQ